MQYCVKIQASLDLYLESRKLDQFDKLKELLIADRVKENLHQGIKAHIYLKESEAILDDEQFQLSLQIKQQMRDDAKSNILKLQEQSRQQYNRNRREAGKYNGDKVVAIKKTQFDVGAKLRPRYFGPYEVEKIRFNDQYDVKKIGRQEGPNLTCTSADLMKP